MTDYAAELSTILKTVSRPGDFYASGAFDLVAPMIDIDGFGPLALPVLPDQCKRLIATAALAPFGRGEQTVIDTSVRRSWQISPDRVRIAGKRWTAALVAVVARAVEGLGVAGEVEAVFYKLLVYEAGSFFVSHRDTEKSPGMFGTLVIALPSPSEGGDLVVRHAGREAAIDMRSDDPGEARFAAFYADCVHEVRPVEAGCRVTLIYNLIRKGERPEPPRYDGEEKSIARLLDAWRQEADEEEGRRPAKLVYPLDHAYTPAELAFASLKGADAAAAGTLVRAATRAECDLHLALLTVEESGSASLSGRGWSGHGRWSEPDDDDAYDMEEIFDDSAILTEWRALDDKPPAFGAMPVLDDEFSPPDAVEAMSPDEQHFHEATGNEGATLERTYRRAALILWPKAGVMAMLAAAGLAVSLPYLQDLADRHGRDAGSAQASSILEEADDLAGAIIANWPQGRQYGRQTETTSATTLLDLLGAIKAPGRIRQFLLRSGNAESRSKADNRAVIEALSTLPPLDRAAIVEHLMEDAGLLCFAACADLLARVSQAWADVPAAALKGAARRLLAFCPKDRAATPGYPPNLVDDDTVAHLLHGLSLIDPHLATDAVERVLSWPDTFDMDRRLVPALRHLVADPSVATMPAVTRLRTACIAHLTERATRLLEPPADWTRANSLPCACADCSALASFLADPTLAVWTLKAVQHARSHVESTISNAHCDVDTETIRQGSPHRLTVTKNQASYERLAQQRRDDLAILAELGAAV